MTEFEPDRDDEPVEISSDAMDRLLKDLARDCDEEGTLKDVRDAKTFRGLIRNTSICDEEDL